jgi:hypothetical protein
MHTLLHWIDAEAGADNIFGHNPVCLLPPLKSFSMISVVDCIRKLFSPEEIRYFCALVHVPHHSKTIFWGRYHLPHSSSEARNHWRLSVKVVRLPNLLWKRRNSSGLSHTSQLKLVDFLNYLFTERNLSVSAIKGYKSAIATSLRLIGCWENVLDETCVIALKSMSRVKVQTPHWDLSLVLSALMKEPFEPVEKASLKYVTF